MKHPFSDIKFILCDIEGTTSPISFVHKILFPYSEKKLSDFLANPILETAADEKEFEQALKLIKQTMVDENITLSLEETLFKWIRLDRKHGGLKIIQGLIWQQGFYKGELKGHVYSDALVCLENWKRNGFSLGIYSSGSVQAQKLLFSHTEKGNLLSLFSAFFDTAVGGKKEIQSYQKIYQHLIKLNSLIVGLKGPGNILFLSDVLEECEAAHGAGFQTGLVRRPEDVPFQLKSNVQPTFDLEVFSSFEQIDLK